ncbi:uncharacterized protein LOC112906685 [Agrilus planipennis]|uniref:Uncharacterized protein LOC112906685 n=1 Tax=Agrilus planipennis TaxID=224129 RepID=A0A7F5RM31_AGRPL|nr:uncharacterized protein LOC112906685 [Agrilus planipennis]
MFKLVLLFTCLAFLDSAYGLRCISCNSVKDPDCANQPPQKYSVECAHLVLNIYDSFCLKKVTKDRDGKETTVRKCSAVENKDFTNECSVNPGTELVYCQECKDDLCNSANTNRFTFLGIMSAILVYFVTNHF